VWPNRPTTYPAHQLGERTDQLALSLPRPSHQQAFQVLSWLFHHSQVQLVLRHIGAYVLVELKSAHSEILIKNLMGLIPVAVWSHLAGIDASCHSRPVQSSDIDLIVCSDCEMYMLVKHPVTRYAVFGSTPNIPYRFIRATKQSEATLQAMVGLTETDE
jgi:cytochrome P450